MKNWFITGFDPNPALFDVDIGVNGFLKFFDVGLLLFSNLAAFSLDFLAALVSIDNLAGQ